MFTNDKYFERDSRRYLLPFREKNATQGFVDGEDGARKLKGSKHNSGIIIANLEGQPISGATVVDVRVDAASASFPFEFALVPVE